MLSKPHQILITGIVPSRRQIKSAYNTDRANMTQGHHTNQGQGKQSKVQTTDPRHQKSRHHTTSKERKIEITRTGQTIGHKGGKTAYKHILAKRSDRGNIQQSIGPTRP
jgi:hypothetical protein